MEKCLQLPVKLIGKVITVVIIVMKTNVVQVGQMKMNLLSHFELKSLFLIPVVVNLFFIVSCRSDKFEYKEGYKDPLQQ